MPIDAEGTDDGPPALGKLLIADESDFTSIAEEADEADVEASEVPPPEAEAEDSTSEATWADSAGGTEEGMEGVFPTGTPPPSLIESRVLLFSNLSPPR